MTFAAQMALAIGLGYLYGSIPSAYLLVRARKGIDLRHHGTGSIGISNAVQQAGGWVIVPLVVYDVLVKGWLPVFLASGVVLDLGATMQVAIAVSVIVGHNWPVYLKLQGGRGVAPSLGALLALHWPLLVVFGGFVTVLWATTRNSPVAWFIATVAVPVFAAGMWALGGAIRPDGPDLAFAVLYVFLVLLRRLLGSWPGTQQTRAPGMSKARVALNRLVLDRDTGDRDEWVKRRPIHRPGQAARDSASHE